MGNPLRRISDRTRTWLTICTVVGILLTVLCEHGAVPDVHREPSLVMAVRIVIWEAVGLLVLHRLGVSAFDRRRLRPRQPERRIVDPRWSRR
jgi:hypothetical protein